MTIKERIMEVLENLDNNEMVELHNRYCDESNRMDDYIYSMQEFDEIMNGYTPWDVARAAFFGDFNPTYDYFWFNGYANLVSSDFPAHDSNSPIYASDIANWMIDNENALDIDEIQDIFDEMDEIED